MFLAVIQFRLDFVTAIHRPPELKDPFYLAEKVVYEVLYQNWILQCMHQRKYTQVNITEKVYFTNSYNFCTFVQLFPWSRYFG